MRLFFSFEAPSSNEFVSGRLNRERQVLKHVLEQNPLAVVCLVAEGSADSLQDELRRSVERYREAVALKEASRDDAREGVYCAGIVRREVGTGDFPGAAVRAASCNDRCEIGLSLHRNAGDDDDVGAGVREFRDGGLQFVVSAFRAERIAQKREEFGEVGREDVGAHSERSHLAHHLIRDFPCDKALADAATMLMLSKKAEAIWGAKES